MKRLLRFSNKTEIRGEDNNNNSNNNNVNNNKNGNTSLISSINEDSSISSSMDQSGRGGGEGDNDYDVDENDDVEHYDNHNFLLKRTRESIQRNILFDREDADSSLMVNHYFSFGNNMSFSTTATGGGEEDFDSVRERSATFKIFPHPEKLIPIFELGVPASNHRYHMKVYHDVFVASDAVTFLVENQKITRKQAVAVGRILQKDYRLFEHVCQDHLFSDRYLYFKYLPREQRVTPIIDKSVAKSMVLSDIATYLEKGVLVMNRRYRLKQYKCTFIGSEAVDILCRNGFVDNRSDAVKLGRILFKELCLFEHCTNDKPFEDDYYFYRFKDKSHRRLQSIRANTLTASDALSPSSTRKGGNKNDDENNSSNNNNDKLAALLDAANTLENGILIKDYKFRSKTYKDTFIASNAVDFMINSSLAETRRDAVKLGREMAKHLNLFQHVTNEHEFSDDYLFFKFTNDNDRVYSQQQQQSYEQYDNKELHDIATTLRKNIKVEKHRYMARIYPNTFIGSEMVDYLFNNGYVESRRQAVKLGRKLAKQYHLFRHVTNDHELKDEHLFFRFCDNDSTTSSSGGGNDDDYDDIKMKDIETAVNSVDRSIDDIARSFRNGMQVSTHIYRLRSYKDTFNGFDAVSSLATICKTATRKDALLIGRKLQAEYNLFDQITKEQNNILKDQKNLIYRFNKDEEITGGLNLVEVDLEIRELWEIAKDLEANVELRDNRNLMRVYRNTFAGREVVDYLIANHDSACKSRSEAVQIGRILARKFHLFEHVTRDWDFCDEDYCFFRFIKPEFRTCWTEETEDSFFEQEEDDESADKFSPESDEFHLTSEEMWKIRVTAFEDRVKKKMMEQQKLQSSRRAYANSDHVPLSFLQFDDCPDPKKALLRANVQFWLSTFRRTDPRYQILKFFTEVSQEGADNIEETGLQAGRIKQLAKYFYRASVFTVWRPTSFEAIKKMMLGTAVGKGLDIKGKSAKRGKLSGFVPFLQISENKHKRMVKRLPKDGVVRIFFSGDARGDRDIAAEKLEAIADEMIQTVKKAKAILFDKKYDKEERKDAKASLALDMLDPSISYIDDYSPGAFGIEIPSRLFWEAYVVRQDITREAGSMYGTGRPSQPAFQDMNFAALLASPMEDTPRAVLYQNADEGSPMNPFELLMAYEEMDRVKPVVSDFDCFLVGTRGVPFKNPLPRDQIDTLKWCVNEIQKILDGPIQAESWTSRWLEVLTTATTNGFHPDFPRFGFSDPKSYSIMEHAVGRLGNEGSGAVRHGAECFNFYFPQELDDEFLVIAENIPDSCAENIPDSCVPWKYMGVEELQSFLHRQIDLGYTFPLNLKWVLCDIGWKSLYDKLVDSQRPNVQDSLSIWYPPESGLREQIEEISTRHPLGFQRLENASLKERQSGTGPMDLALEEMSSSMTSFEKMPGEITNVEQSDEETRRSVTADMDLTLNRLSSIVPEPTTLSRFCTR